MTASRSWIMGVVLCCLLAVATSASAEGAWIVWDQTIGPDTTDPKWTPYKAVATFSECEAETLSAAEGAGKVFDLIGGDKVKVLKNIVVVQRDGGGGKPLTMITTYRCFPDTVDPRGPKGGK